MSQEKKIPFGGDINKVITLINYHQEQAAKDKRLYEESRKSGGASNLFQHGADVKELMFVGAIHLTKAANWQKVLEDVANAEIEGTDYEDIFAAPASTVSQTEPVKTEETKQEPAKQEPAKQEPAKTEETKETKPAEEKPADAPKTGEEDNKDKPVVLLSIKYPKSDLDKLEIKDLKKIAKDEGIKHKSKINKKSIVALLVKEFAVIDKIRKSAPKAEDKPADKPVDQPAKTDEPSKEEKPADKPAEDKPAETKNEPVKEDSEKDTTKDKDYKPVMKVLHGGESLNEIKKVVISKTISKEVAETYFKKGLCQYSPDEVTAEDLNDDTLVIETRDIINPETKEREFTVTKVPKLENGKQVLDAKNEPVMEEIKVPKTKKVKRSKSGRELAYDTVVDYLVNNGVKLAGIKKYDLTDYVREIATEYNKLIAKEKREAKFETFKAMKLPTARPSMVAPNIAELVKVTDFFENGEFNLKYITGDLDGKANLKADDLVRLQAIHLAASGRFAEGANLLAVEFKDVEGMDDEISRMYLSDLMSPKNHNFVELDDIIKGMLLDGHANHKDHLKHKELMIKLITQYSNAPKTNKDKVVTKKVDGKDVVVLNKWSDDKITRFIDGHISALIKSKVKAAQLPDTCAQINPEATLEAKAAKLAEVKAEQERVKKEKIAKDEKELANAKKNKSDGKSDKPKVEADKGKDKTESPSKTQTEIKGKRAPNAPKEDKKKEGETPAANNPVSKTEGEKNPVLQVEVKSNKDKTVHEFTIQGSDCAGKFRPDKNSKETLNEYIAKTWKGYFGRFIGQSVKAKKNKTVKVPVVPEAFITLKPTSKFDINIIEKQAS